MNLKFCGSTSSIWGFSFKELRWFSLQMPETCVLWVGSTPCMQLLLADVSGLWHYQDLCVCKPNLGFTFTASHQSFLGPPCKDSNPGTCFLASVALQNHGRRFYDLLNHSCFQNQYHMQDTTKFCYLLRMDAGHLGP